MTTNNHRFVRWASLPAGALVGVLALAGCSGGTETTATPAADADQNIVFALKEDPTCIDPQQTSLTTSLNVGRQIVDSLLDQDPETGELVPWLAESWDVSDDLTSYTFTLQDGVTFSDGTALTSQVVADNFDAIAALGASASLANGYLENYAGTDVTSDTEFTVNFSQPNVQFEQGATTMSLGILSEDTIAATAEERCQSIVGTGAFTLTSYVPNDSVVIDRRDGYDWASELREHEGDAYLETVTFPIITEASVRTGGLTSGEYDVIQDLPYVDEARYTTDEYNLYAQANPGVPNSFVVNTTHGLMGDESVRQAISKGLDRDQINVIAGSVSGSAPTSVLTSSTPGYTDLGDTLAFDPEGAQALLEADGWVLGSDGIYEKDGEKLTVTVTAFYAQDVLEAAQIQLKDVGIDLQLNMVSAGDFFGAIASGDYDMLGAGLTRTDPDVLRVLLSDSSSSQWGITGDDELEALLIEQGQTADADERQTIVDEIQQMVADRAYVIPTLETVQLHASRSGVEGITFDSASRINLYDAMVTSN
ncbi:peptide/nickel transport system substrate-binding protein [Microbacterium endophyticum]|uniref:Peptide/nickel transport system substrate-binding protein n=1 Tax=Microbacterium endophyticum TaxID=1526412 RepID=A0A7W4V4W9_9MICO|nr:ABC transporter substrate-binding protein [Microbacterium endophyticum]MBB2976921.1 peptide/nickel transport system substrate-binding protein [Microbacterium endophyticum]NIK35761.1 peptide/nickel transport system substrate-binding protein [Microbacterium endophyticum]